MPPPLPENGRAEQRNERAKKDDGKIAENLDSATESDIPETVSVNIKEALVAYRTKTYKLNRIKAYEVFKNASCDRIAKFAPTTLEDLKALRCLDEAQLALYGQDIIEIVQKALNA